MEESLISKKSPKQLRKRIHLLANHAPKVADMHRDTQDPWSHRFKRLQLLLTSQSICRHLTLHKLILPHCNQTATVSPQCTQRGASWLARMQQVTAAMWLVRKLPGRPGPPNPPPVLSTDERQEGEAIKQRGERSRGDRREGRGRELSWWRRRSRRKAQQDIFPAFR